MFYVHTQKLHTWNLYKPAFDFIQALRSIYLFGVHYIQAAMPIMRKLERNGKENNKWIVEFHPIHLNS